MRTPIAALLLTAQTGCIIVLGDKDEGPSPFDDSGQVGCDDIAVSSVNISVVDPSGNPTHATEVWYTVNGGERQPAECLNDVCSSWMAGWESTGTFVIEGKLYEPLEDSSCYMWDEDTVTVEVPMDDWGCHPVTQQVTLTLDPSIIQCDDC